MKILKYLFFLLLIVFIGGAIYFATKDGSYTIEESHIIDAPKKLVFDKVNDFKTWENWGPWKKEDPTMIFNYPQKTKGEGASYSWNGKDVDGKMRTTKVIENERIEQEITMQTPGGERTSMVTWEFQEVDGGTKVTWRTEGEHPLMDKAYFTITGTDFESDLRGMFITGLKGLDSNIIEDMSTYAIDVSGLTQHSGGFYMYTTASVKKEALADKIAPMFESVLQFMDNNNIPKSGMPMTLYNDINTENGNLIISTAIPVSSRIVTPSDSDILCGYMPSQTVVKTTLKGDYKNLEEAWDKTEAFVKENDVEKNPEGTPFELYVNDPEDYPNPADWITEIYIPVTVENQ